MAIVRKTFWIHHAKTITQVAPAKNIFPPACVMMPGVWVPQCGRAFFRGGIKRWMKPARTPNWPADAI